MEVEQELIQVTQAHDRATVEHAILSSVITLACDELQVAQPAAANMLVARTDQIPYRVCELKRDILYGGVNQVFAITHSHYVNINLEALSLGYLDNYSNAELDALEAIVVPLSQDLSDRIEDLVFPHGG